MAETKHMSLQQLKKYARGITKKEIAERLDTNNRMFHFNTEHGPGSYRRYTRDELLSICITNNIDPGRKWVTAHDGHKVNVKNYIQGLHTFPSYAHKVMGVDGRATLTHCCFAVIKCGCQIVGNGTLQFPLDIKFCNKHKNVHL